MPQSKKAAAGSDGTTTVIPVINAIEALNFKLRGAVRARGHFPTDEATMKLLFLILNRSEKELKMQSREWTMAKRNSLFSTASALHGPWTEIV